MNILSFYLCLIYQLIGFIVLVKVRHKELSSEPKDTNIHCQIVINALFSVSNRNLYVKSYKMSFKRFFETFYSAYFL